MQNWLWHGDIAKVTLRVVDSITGQGVAGVGLGWLGVSNVVAEGDHVTAPWGFPGSYANQSADTDATGRVVAYVMCGRSATSAEVNAAGEIDALWWCPHRTSDGTTYDRWAEPAHVAGVHPAPCTWVQDRRHHNYVVKTGYKSKDWWVGPFTHRNVYEVELPVTPSNASSEPPGEEGCPCAEVVLETSVPWSKPNLLVDQLTKLAAGIGEERAAAGRYPYRFETEKDWYQPTCKIPTTCPDGAASSGKLVFGVEDDESPLNYWPYQWEWVNVQVQGAATAHHVNAVMDNQKHLLAAIKHLHDEHCQDALFQTAKAYADADKFAQLTQLVMLLGTCLLGENWMEKVNIDKERWS